MFPNSINDLTLNAVTVLLGIIFLIILFRRALISDRYEYYYLYVKPSMDLNEFVDTSQKDVEYVSHRVRQNKQDKTWQILSFGLFWVSLKTAEETWDDVRREWETDRSKIELHRGDCVRNKHSAKMPLDWNECS